MFPLFAILYNLEQYPTYIALQQLMRRSVRIRDRRERAEMNHDEEEVAPRPRNRRNRGRNQEDNDNRGNEHEEEEAIGEEEVEEEIWKFPLRSDASHLVGRQNHYSNHQFCMPGRPTLRYIRTLSS